MKGKTAAVPPFLTSRECPFARKKKTKTTGERASLRCPCCRTTVSRNAWHAGDKFSGLSLGGGPLLWQPAEAALEKVTFFPFFPSSFSKDEKAPFISHALQSFFSCFFSPNNNTNNNKQEDSPMESRIKLDTALNLKGNFLFGESFLVFRFFFFFFCFFRSLSKTRNQNKPLSPS